MIQKVAEDSAAATHHARRGVQNSLELRRILDLPRRILDIENPPVDYTERFAKSGELSLRPIQNAGLHEANETDGLFAPIAVGGGKTLLALLLPAVMGAKNAVILTKPGLKKQMIRERETFYGKHFHLPPSHIVAYTELSSAGKAEILTELKPDLIIADEAHCIGNRSSARTKRFLRYMKANPSTLFCALSGTMTSRSIKDYAHLIDLALGKNSPLPCRYGDLLEWAAALDTNIENRMPPGFLALLCESGEEVRSGYRRRLIQSPGVVATSEGSIGTSLVVMRRIPDVPYEIQEIIKGIRLTWSLEDEEFTTALEMDRVLKQVSCGFYYQWDWPHGIVDTEWLEARALYAKEVRQKLKYSREGMDSPLLLHNAAERFHIIGLRGSNCWESEHWPGWQRVKDRWKPTPPVKTIWVDDFLVQDALKWAIHTKERGIIWCQHKALSERIARTGGIPLYGAGTDAGTATAPVIVCTTATQGTGKNLQHYYEHNLFTSLPPNGKAVEQILGRTHRPGQLADEVTVEWCAHTEVLENAMPRVIEDARYMEATTGQKQKILYATRIDKE